MPTPIPGLVINTLTLDESFTTNAGDSDVPSFTGNLQSLINGAGASSLIYNGFPQRAEIDNFVSGQSGVTDYFFASSAGGAAIPAAGIATSFYVGTDQVYLFATSDPNVLVGRVGTGTTANASGAIAVVIAIDEALVSGVLTANLGVELYAPLTHHGVELLDSADTLSLLNTIWLGATFATSTPNEFKDFSGVPSGQDAFALITPTVATNPVNLLVTGFKGTTVGTVNVSSTGLGAFSQAVDTNESLRFDVVTATAADLAKADTAAEVHDAANISYDHHLDATAASFQLVQVNPTGKPTTLTVAVFEVGDVKGAAFPTDAIGTTGAIAIAISNVHVLNASKVDVTAQYASQITLTAGGVQVAGLLNNFFVSIDMGTTVFDRFTVTNTSSSRNSSFDLGNIVVTTRTTGTDTIYGELGSHIVVEDGGPSVGVTGATVPTVTVDETYLNTASTPVDCSGLFSVNYGPDGAGTTSYALGISSTLDSGLVDTLTGLHVMLSVNGTTGVVSGTITGGLTVFTVAVDGSGNVTLNQSRAVVHSDANHLNYDEVTSLNSGTLNAAGLITLTATAHDSEASGDSSTSATVGIGLALNFHDDGPGMQTDLTGGSAVSATAGANTATGSETFSTATYFGNDGGHVSIAHYADLSGIGLTAVINAAHTLLTYQDSGGADVRQPPAVADDHRAARLQRHPVRQPGGNAERSGARRRLQRGLRWLVVHRRNGSARRRAVLAGIVLDLQWGTVGGRR